MGDMARLKMQANTDYKCPQGSPKYWSWALLAVNLKYKRICAFADRRFEGQYNDSAGKTLGVIHIHICIDKIK